MSIGNNWDGPQASQFLPYHLRVFRSSKQNASRASGLRRDERFWCQFVAAIWCLEWALEHNWWSQGLKICTEKIKYQEEGKMNASWVGLRPISYRAKSEEAYGLKKILLQKPLLGRMYIWWSKMLLWGKPADTIYVPLIATILFLVLKLIICAKYENVKRGTIWFYPQAMFEHFAWLVKNVLLMVNK